MIEPKNIIKEPELKEKDIHNLIKDQKEEKPKYIKRGPDNGSNQHMGQYHDFD